MMTNSYLRKYNSTDYSYNKGESVERWLTKFEKDTKCTYTSKEIYKRKTTNRFGTFLPGDHKVKEAFDTYERYHNILECWKEISSNEKKDVLQVSAGLNHFQRDVCIIDIDADNWKESFFVQDVRDLLKPTYIIETQSGHLQVGFVYSSHISAKQNTRTYLWGNKAVRYIAARSSLLRDGQKYGDDNYCGWQCKNPYSKRVVQLFYNEDNVTDPTVLLNRFSSLVNAVASKFQSVDVARADQRIKATEIYNTPFSLSIYNSNKGNSSENSRTVVLYNKLRTAITKIKNERAKRNEQPVCSFTEALNAAISIAKENQLGKGMLPMNEIEATTRCTLKWVNTHWKPFDKDSERASANMKKIAEFEKQIRDMQFIVLHGKIMAEKEKRQKLGCNCSTRAIAEALNISNKTVSIHNRKTISELYKYVQSANKVAAKFIDSSVDSTFRTKYSSLVESYNNVIEIYITPLLLSIYNSNKGNSSTTTETNKISTTYKIGESKKMMSWKDLEMTLDENDFIEAKSRSIDDLQKEADLLFNEGITVRDIDEDEYLASFIKGIDKNSNLIVDDDYEDELKRYLIWQVYCDESSTQFEDEEPSDEDNFVNPFVEQ